MSIIQKNVRCEKYEIWIVGDTGFVSEMEIEENGERVFLYSYWTCLCEDALDYAVTKESVFDYLTDKKEWDKEEGFDSVCLSNEREEKYSEQFAVLEDLLKEKAAEEGVDYGCLCDEEDEDDMYEEMMHIAETCKYAIFLESEVHGIHNQPCRTEEEALELAELMYKQELENGKMTKCQVCEVEIGVSEIIGYVYNVKRVIEDFAS